MHKQYFNDELKKIRELAKHFAQHNPEYAQYLGANSFDPDVERLMEGFAFLTADMHQRLDADYPEFLRTLAETVCAELLLPTPSATMLAFKPRANLLQTTVVPKGTLVDSKPHGNVVCHFKTCYDLAVTPLNLLGVAGELVSADKGDFVRVALTFDAGKAPLAKADLSRVSLYLHGEYGDACQLYYLLSHFVRDITVVQAKKAVAWIDPVNLRPGGFGPEHAVFTRGRNDLTELGLLKEYFVFPQKFLTFNLDLSSWASHAHGSRFILVIDCDVPSFGLPNIQRDSIVLNAVPAINLFPHKAEPVVLDHKTETIPLRVAGKEKDYAEIYSVDAVEGAMKTSRQKRQYLPFHQWIPQQSGAPYFQMKRLSIEGVHEEFMLSVAYPEEQPVSDGEVLMSTLSCTNGKHAEQLMPGSITVPGYGMSELLTFTNLTQPSQYYPAVNDSAVLAFLMAHLNVNQMSLSNAHHVRELIRHYLPPGELNVLHQRRIDAIANFEVRLEEQLLDRYFVQGQSLFLKLKGDAFVKQGDLFLFGSILSYVFASSVSMNTATRLTIENQVNGEQIKWPTRLGERLLL